ncbi:putative F-box domain, FBD domain, leucine-rich repeat domain, L domain-containing protein [Medicago truncatula]|uniref:Putative F-box domain, FBD domain, leucine-rich repeat domain, L domain-containing protein n=1 Tax=Medicago truncatula TaxID=3880 RepID=G7JLF9_MEDTR|nr:putative F-box/LRR-repeat protein At4g15060 isoform X1 [Medicago truncatula]AES91048.1 ubiquitin-protein ligase, putative [Medicago truncatula]RHN63381.1 putative F-box domain, FBD domain, leucine-rich repeat domain, L domain-containing protein [Medicago truncatula]
MQDGTSKDGKQKRAKSNNEKDYEEDIINQLPDGIPINILANLPIKEAARTSILSRKWKNLWTYFSGTLEFEGSPIMKDMIKDLKKVTGGRLQMAMEIMYDAERQTYTSWINELLSSLQCSTLQGLKFWFPMKNVSDIDNWIHFAVQKKVQKLELYFGHTIVYVLPLHIFKVERFNSLCVLRMKSITVTDEMLEYLMCNCQLLETLSLVDSRVPKTMKVSGSSLKLKCLELVRCWELTKIEIFAEKLVSFKYYGSHLETEFKSVPCLEEASFGGSFVEFVRESFLPQIKVLKLDITQNSPEVIYWLSQLPKLKNLKHLELVACADDGISACVMLLKASPSLWRLKIKMLNTKPTYITEHKFTMECHYNLKELELVGFCGAACEVELVMYILENTDELQKITIDTRLPTKPKLRPLDEEHFETWDLEEKKRCAWRLKDKIPPCIEFVCL